MEVLGIDTPGKVTGADDVSAEMYEGEMHCAEVVCVLREFEPLEDCSWGKSQIRG